MPGIDKETGERNLNAPNLAGEFGSMLIEHLGVDETQPDFRGKVNKLLLNLLDEVEIVTVAGAAEILGVSTQRVRQLEGNPEKQIPMPDPIFDFDGRKTWLREEVVVFRNARQPIKDALAERLANNIHPEN